jgi:hypothetical protein
MARLITAANARYIMRIMPYLGSLSANSQIPATLVCVGNFISYPHLPNINSVILPHSENYGAPSETECPQHGAFLQVIDGPDDEVLIFTDGDIIMQRPFTEQELTWLENLPADTVAAGYNSGPDETLAVEAGRLFPRFGLDQIGARLGYMDRPCFNIGVIAARRRTWQRIYTEYMTRWQLVTEAFGHPARQQWLVVNTIHRLGIRVEVTPYSLHANGHYGMPPGCYYRGGVLYAGEEVVCLRHKL